MRAVQPIMRPIEAGFLNEARDRHSITIAEVALQRCHGDSGDARQLLVGTISKRVVTDIGDRPLNRACDRQNSCGMPRQSRGKAGEQIGFKPLPKRGIHVAAHTEPSSQPCKGMLKSAWPLNGEREIHRSEAARLADQSRRSNLNGYARKMKKQDAGSGRTLTGHGFFSGGEEHGASGDMLPFTLRRNDNGIVQRRDQERPARASGQLDGAVGREAANFRIGGPYNHALRDRGRVRSRRPRIAKPALETWLDDIDCGTIAAKCEMHSKSPHLWRQVLENEANHFSPIEHDRASLRCARLVPALVIKGLQRAARGHARMDKA